MGEHSRCSILQKDIIIKAGSVNPPEVKNVPIQLPLTSRLRGSSWTKGEVPVAPLELKPWTTLSIRDWSLLARSLRRIQIPCTPMVASQLPKVHGLKLLCRTLPGLFDLPAQYY